MPSWVSQLTILNWRCWPSLRRTEVVALPEARRWIHYDGRRGQHSRSHPPRHQIPPPHSPALGIAPLRKLNTSNVTSNFTSDVCFLRIRHHILLHFQVIQQIEVGIQIVILLESLQIAHCRARLRLRLDLRQITTARIVEIVVLGEEQARSDCHQHGERRRQHRTPEPCQPACLRLGHLFAQPRLQTHIKIRRQLRRTPFIQQRHGLADLCHLSGARAATSQMSADLRCHPHQTGRQVWHHFANLLTLHNQCSLVFSSPCHFWQKQPCCFL